MVAVTGRRVRNEKMGVGSEKEREWRGGRSRYSRIYGQTPPASRAKSAVVDVVSRNTAFS